MDAQSLERALDGDQGAWNQIVERYAALVWSVCRRYGLAGSVWTDDPERGLGIARRARVGTFGVNLYVPDIGAPWGGRKASGMGSVYGPEGLQTYLATKCVFLPG